MWYLQFQPNRRSKPSANSNAAYGQTNLPTAILFIAALLLHRETKAMKCIVLKSFFFVVAEPKLSSRPPLF